MRIQRFCFMVLLLMPSAALLRAEGPEIQVGTISETQSTDEKLRGLMLYINVKNDISVRL
jgi:hypothetical protein